MLGKKRPSKDTAEELQRRGPDERGKGLLAGDSFKEGGGGRHLIPRKRKRDVAVVEGN